MKKSIYIIGAVAVAVAMTFAQMALARSAVTKNRFDVVCAVADIKAGTTIKEGNLKVLSIYLEDGPGPEDITKDSVIGKIAVCDIPEGGIINSGQFTELEPGRRTRMLSLEVSGANFNAYDLMEGDVVDLYMIPDTAKIEPARFIWLKEKLEAAGMTMEREGLPGVLFENIRIGHISQGAGGTARYASIEVDKPLDEAISLLERMGDYEFIKH
jgi:hypothetical protein